MKDTLNSLRKKILRLELEVDQLKEQTNLLKGDLATAHRGLADKRIAITALELERNALQTTTARLRITLDRDISEENRRFKAANTERS